MIGQDSDSNRASALTLLLAFIISALFLITDRGSERLLAQTKTGAETGFAPILTLLSKPVRAVESVSASFTDRSRAIEENKTLRDELYALREYQQRAELMETKLKRLEQILAARSGVDIPTQKIAARAVSEVEGPFVRSALINSGANKGVKKGHPVMTVNGLYGHILRAGPSSARVLLLGDLNSHIPVMSARSGARAILSGDNSGEPRLSFVQDRADWQVDDRVTTSGDAGVMPQGLPVGRVKRGSDGQLVVKLHTAGKAVDWVWVYPYEPITIADIIESPDQPMTPDATDADETTAAADETPQIPQSGAP